MRAHLVSFLALLAQHQDETEIQRFRECAASGASELLLGSFCAALSLSEAFYYSFCFFVMLWAFLGHSCFIWAALHYSWLSCAAAATVCRALGCLKLLWLLLCAALGFFGLLLGYSGRLWAALRCSGLPLVVWTASATTLTLLLGCSLLGCSDCPELFWVALWLSLAAFGCSALPQGCFELLPCCFGRLA